MDFGKIFDRHTANNVSEVPIASAVFFLKAPFECDLGHGHYSLKANA